MAPAWSSMAASVHARADSPDPPSEAAPQGDSRLLVDDDAVRAFLLEEYGALGERAQFEFVSGGVSSTIIRVTADDECFILKQALPQLRVATTWLSNQKRSGIEVRCARLLERFVPGSIPEILREFPQRYAFSMACAPTGSVTWKAMLLEGDIRGADARKAGSILGDIHAKSTTVPGLVEDFADKSIFDELRVDAYLRFTATRHPDLAEMLHELAAAMLGPGICLVHADFSPKNLLVTPDDRMLAIDHEVAHWGSPSFDLGFLLNHLCLKALRFPRFADEYLAAADETLTTYRSRITPDIDAAAAGQLGGRMLGALMLARIDGKSPVEYIEEDGDRDRVRAVARRILTGDVANMDAALAVVRSARA